MPKMISHICYTEKVQKKMNNKIISEKYIDISLLYKKKQYFIVFNY